MSFQKRKTSYRKGVTSTTLDEYPVPKENESLARIANPRGGNMFEVILDFQQSHIGGTSGWTEVAGDITDQVQQAHLDEAWRLCDRYKIGGTVHNFFRKAEWSGVHDPAHSNEGPSELHQKGGTLVRERRHSHD